MNSTPPGEFRPVPERDLGFSKGVADRLLYWPVMLAFGWPVVLVLVWTAPDPWGFVAVLAVYLFWAVSACGAFIAALAWLRLRAWRRSASTLVLPAISLAALLNGSFVAHAIKNVGSDLQLAAALPKYFREISKLPANEGPRLGVFSWRDLNGFGLYLGYELLVYDESGEIALPPAERSAVWIKKAADTDLHCSLTGVNHAFGHFYFVGRGFDC